MPEVRTPRFRNGVEIDVDDVVEHAHRRRHRLLQPRLVQPAVLYMVDEVDRAEIADRGLLVRGVERDLGAEIRGVDYAGVALRRAEIAGILEGDPGMSGLEQHGQHLAPEIDGADLLEDADFAA